MWSKSEKKNLLNASGVVTLSNGTRWRELKHKTGITNYFITPICMNHIFISTKIQSSTDTVAICRENTAVSLYFYLESSF